MYGLDENFLSAADRLSMDDIKTRFNHATNAGVTDDQRWGAANIVRVERDAARRLSPTRIGPRPR